MQYESAQLKIYKREHSKRISEKGAYLYFTSGSTGKAKAVLGNFIALEKFVSWEIEEFNLNCNDRYSQFTPVMFDPYLRDILVPLCSGGCICIPPDISHTRVNDLTKWIVKEKITISHLVPSLFRHIFNKLDRENCIRFFLLAGEMLLPSDVHTFWKNRTVGQQMVNLYGTTETTLAKFFHIIDNEDLDAKYIPVGKPIDSKSYCIIKDENGNLLSQEELGDVYISTPYSSDGYAFNETENNRFAIDPEVKGNVTFRTGDRGYINKQNNLVIIGRSDNLVKILGKKVQLEELEQLIKKYLSWDQVGVVYDEELNKRLFIAVLEKEYNQKKERQINKRISELINMPFSLLPLKYIPRNSNGKIDRHKLREVSYKYYSSLLKKDVDTLNTIEGRIYRIIKEITGEFDIIIRNEDKLKSIFDSLDYVRFIVEIEEEFGMEMNDEALDSEFFDSVSEVVAYISAWYNGEGQDVK